MLNHIYGRAQQLVAKGEILPRPTQILPAFMPLIFRVTLPEKYISQSLF